MPVTREWSPERGWYETNADFRGYGSPAESTADWWRLMNTKRYGQVLTAQSVGDAARAVASGGYATDPQYADKLVHAIQMVASHGGNVAANIAAGVPAIPASQVVARVAVNTSHEA